MLNSENQDQETTDASIAQSRLLPAVLWRDERHSHFWIEDEELHESYNTIRGLRYRWRLTVNGLPDTDRCADDMLLYIQSEFL